MKQLLTKSFFFIIALWISGCAKEVKLPEEVVSAPKTISGLRKVDLDRNFTLGVTSIRGIVTSDPAAGNNEDGTLIVQSENEDAAIVLKLQGSASAFSLHQEVSINLQGASLSIQHGELTVHDLPADQIVPTGKQVSVQPKITNIPTLKKEASFWGPILVRLEKVELQGGSQGKLSGEITLSDGVSTIISPISPSADFSGNERPDFVEAYSGILRISDEEIFIRPRNIKDIQVGLKEMLEDFEQASSTSYDKKSLEFRTGSWTIDGGITASTSADLKNGQQSIRLQGTIGNEKRKGVIQMEFDLIGVQGISVWHGIYPAGAETSNVNPTTFDIEISRDGGKTYTLLQQVEVDIHSGELKRASAAVEAGFSEPVRFRIVNSSTPFANNNRPRISIDDILFEF